ncbi:MAG: helix-turn-helix transcriptional regulator [Clostridiaceae bacterium]|nr:helix-turn-helix transcriptional regulator [Clostridiaceae bacterium]
MEGSRLIELRSALNNISQEELGERIGLSRSGISNIEKGKRALNDRHIKLICTEFDVNEHWLRTGEGDMFRTLSSDEEFIKIMTEIQVSDDPIIRRILKAYWSLSDSDKAAVQRLVQNFVDSETQTK